MKVTPERAAIASLTAAFCTARSAVTSGLLSLGMPTHTSLAPLSRTVSITSPARRTYSAVHSSELLDGSPTMKSGWHVPAPFGHGEVRPWESLPPNVATTMSGCVSAIARVSSAGQS